VVAFTPDGRVSNVVGGQLDAKGRYASTPSYRVIRDEEGPGHCQAERATGIYIAGGPMSLARIRHHPQALADSGPSQLTGPGVWAEYERLLAMRGGRQQ